MIVFLFFSFKVGMHSLDVWKTDQRFAIWRKMEEDKKIALK